MPAIHSMDASRVQRRAFLNRWVLLDARYRTARSSIHEALRDMHIYRDSLRWRCPVSSRIAVCEGGYLLVPRVADDCLEYADSAYRHRWQFGLFEIEDDLGVALA
jgi:hypothetical protein